MFCANCGKALASEAGFCSACGKKIGQAQEPPAITTPPQATNIGQGEKSKKTAKSQRNMLILAAALFLVIVVGVGVGIYFFWDFPQNAASIASTDYEQQTAEREHDNETRQEQTEAEDYTEQTQEEEQAQEPEATEAEYETAYAGITGLWIVQSPTAQGWADSGISWDFHHDGTWVRINENAQGTRIYGIWILDDWGNLTLIAEGFGWENDTRFHTVYWFHPSRVYVTISGNTAPDIVLIR